jgi:hypothetical protein
MPTPRTKQAWAKGGGIEQDALCMCVAGAIVMPAHAPYKAGTPRAKPRTKQALHPFAGQAEGWRVDHGGEWVGWYQGEVGRVKVGPPCVCLTNEAHIQAQKQTR